jgi:hypothetical protein
MASCRILNTSSSIHKITVRNRKHGFVDTKETRSDLNLTSTTSSSPTSPRRIRVVDSKHRSTISGGLSRTERTSTGTASAGLGIRRSYTPSARVIELVNSVVGELWNRDGHGSDHKPALSRCQATARWYVEKFFASLPSELSSHTETVVALAAVFITFKAADFIPGIGRVKMQQLIHAYERACRVVFSEHDCSPLIEEICKAEMDIMCVTDFNFSPV